MKNFRKVIAVSLCAALSCGLLAGCGGQGTEKGVLTIRYYTGGFGDEWLESAREKFLAANPDVKDIKLYSDSQLRSTAVTYLTSNTPDIIMSQNLSWASFVSQGLIEPIDDVYESEVVTSDGNVKIKDYLDDDFAEYGYMQRIAGQGENHAWVLPWSVLTCSIAYNVDYLESTPRRSMGAGQYWTEPPATVSELVEYVGDINARNDGVVPFSWGGSGYNWLLFPGYVWWAQIQGVDESKIEGEGSFYDFWEFQTPEVYKQTGIQGMLNILRDLLVDTDTQSWKNSPDRLEERDTTDVEKFFTDGRAAMCFAGSWLENEMDGFIPEGFNMLMMDTPVVDEAYLEKLGIQSTVDSDVKINNANAGDVMFIPQKAVNKDIAKRFLTFLCSEEMLVEFSEFTGMMRPFKYNPLELSDYEFSDFTKSCFSLYMNSDYNLFEYPKNAVKKQQEDPSFETYIYTYKRPEIFQEVTLNTAIVKLKTLTGEQIMVTGDSASSYKSVYDRVAVEFGKWKAELGLV